VALDELPERPLLACGRDAATVWDRAESGAAADGHERGCPHCTAARADAIGLESMAARMASEMSAHAAAEPPPNVVDRVMSAVRSELRPHELLILDSPEGPARLSSTAAAAVLRAAVDRMDGMRARSCRIEQTGFTADIVMTVTARFGVDMASLAARVRQMVTAAGEQALGLPVRRVDLEIVDVYDEP
jgi:hypothetical protein